ncbi:MAG: hypothetical protein OZSIB_1573 [Candidatus Ozemobacter sibiricus]|jgi:hypothetical protein|uniref:Uncharacterized protein n=1 Tax=Candidatus Ozemobacter sibiricus TaxID=2268124 RepID=A0A367ZLT2_9BACT|nr:MAG: hypothetical protein OZSIB_1573 [Candidatus Ozemobacter sibiricus]
MAIITVTPQLLEDIRQALKLPSFSRPYAVLLDSGDLGTVFTYIPLLAGEYEKLPPELKKAAYCLDKGRYGLIGYLPKTFETPRDGNVAAVSVTYNEFGSIIDLSYTLDTAPETVYHVEHPLRREKLLQYAKKKKLPLRSAVRSSK